MPQADARRVILELIRKADGEWTGKSRLYKAFYFAHLMYSQEHPGTLTNHPIARLDRGPGIDNGDNLLRDLACEGFLSVESVREGPYPENRYRLGARASDLPALSRDACHAIQRAVDYVQPKTASELSSITHERSRSWRLGKNGDLLNIYIDLIPDEEYDRRTIEVEALAQEMQDVLRE